jgi:hypothetical protein
MCRKPTTIHFTIFFSVSYLRKTASIAFPELFYDSLSVPTWYNLENVGPLCRTVFVISCCFPGLCGSCCTQFLPFSEDYNTICNHLSRLSGCSNDALHISVKTNWNFSHYWRGQLSQYSDALDAQGLISNRERFFSPPQPPDQPWGAPSHLSNEYWGRFPVG